MANPLAHWASSSVTKEKSFITLTPDLAHRRRDWQRGQEQVQEGRHQGPAMVCPPDGARR